MSRYNSRPESAIKQAKELVKIGNLEEAVKALRVILTARKHRVWTKAHEPVILMYLDLCVSLKNAQLVKDGLLSYRNIAQSAAPSSLKNAVNALLYKANKNCEEALQKFEQIKKETTFARNTPNALIFLQSGFNLTELSRTYMGFLTAGYNITTASTDGGEIVCQTASINLKLHQVRDFMDSSGYRDLKSTKKLSTLNPQDFDVVVFLDHADQIESFAKAVERFGGIIKQAGLQDSISDIVEAVDKKLALSDDSILLGISSMDNEEDRLRQEIVDPWINFGWSCYRNVLDTLSNNNTLHDLYHSVCHRAFETCEKYPQINFQRLVSVLRKHLKNIFFLNMQPESRLRQHQRTNGVKFQDTVDKHLHTRLRQLDTAMKLRRWTLGRITMLDINTIISKAKRSPNRSLVWQTYITLSRAFFEADNLYAHACALSEAFTLKKKFHKKFNPAQRTHEATQLFLALVCVPVNMQSTYQFHEKELKTLFQFPRTREQLIDSQLQAGLLEDVTDDARELFNILNSEMQPSTLVSTFVNALKRIIQATPSFKKYQKPLEAVVCFRLLEHLSTIYDAVLISKFEKMIQNLETLNFLDVEYMVVHAVDDPNFHIQIDHQTDTLRFSTSIETRRIRTQLSDLYTAMQGVMPFVEEPALIDYQQQQKALMISRAKAVMDREHAETLKRKIIIERRKEEDEILRANAAAAAALASSIAADQADDAADTAPVDDTDGEPGNVSQNEDNTEEPKKPAEPPELTEEEKQERKRQARIRKERLKEARHLDHLTRAVREASIGMWAEFDLRVADVAKEKAKKKFKMAQIRYNKIKEEQGAAFASVAAFADDIAAFADEAVKARKRVIDERTRKDNRRKRAIERLKMKKREEEQRRRDEEEAERKREEEANQPSEHEYSEDDDESDGNRPWRSARSSRFENRRYEDDDDYGDSRSQHARSDYNEDKRSSLAGGRYNMTGRSRFGASNDSNDGGRFGRNDRFGGGRYGDRDGGRYGDRDGDRSRDGGRFGNSRFGGRDGGRFSRSNDDERPRDDGRGGSSGRYVPPSRREGGAGGRYSRDRDDDRYGSGGGGRFGGGGSRYNDRDRYRDGGDRDRYRDRDGGRYGRR